MAALRAAGRCLGKKGRRGRCGRAGGNGERKRRSRGPVWRRMRLVWRVWVAGCNRKCAWQERASSTTQRWQRLLGNEGGCSTLAIASTGPVWLLGQLWNTGPAPVQQPAGCQRLGRRPLLINSARVRLPHFHLTI